MLVALAESGAMLSLVGMILILVIVNACCGRVPHCVARRRLLGDRIVRVVSRFAFRIILSIVMERCLWSHETFQSGAFGSGLQFTSF
jgi:hypothetical protein